MQMKIFQLNFAWSLHIYVACERSALDLCQIAYSHRRSFWKSFRSAIFETKEPKQTWAVPYCAEIEFDVDPFYDRIRICCNEGYKYVILDISKYANRGRS